MELLRKTVTDPRDHKKDNADKKPLFAKEHHPNTAALHKEQWAFIDDVAVRENIAYQMQYLEFLVYLYNDYQVYLTLESLLCKDIIVTVGGIVEAALLSFIQQGRKKAGMYAELRTDFTSLLGQGYHEYGLLTKELWHYFHDLRKTRNNVHLAAADFREYEGYTIEQANECIKKLEEFRTGLK